MKKIVKMNWKERYIFCSLDCDPANTSNRFHSKLQHGLATLFLASALLGTFISTCSIFQHTKIIPTTPANQFLKKGEE